MAFKIKNWKLAALALLLMVVFLRLGFWQLARAHEKQALLTTFAKRMQAPPLSLATASHLTDWRFYRAAVHGEFDNAHTFLLDNKIVAGQVGYEIYTPFYTQGFPHPLLIDRGFVPMGISRRVLPPIIPIKGKVTLIGLLNKAPAYVAFGPINDSPLLSWPLRIEYVNLAELPPFLNRPTPFLPYILMLAPHEPGAYAVKWEIVVMGPERHRGYAIQWFAFALVLLILFVALNRHKMKT